MANVSDFDYVLRDWGEKVVRKIQENMEKLDINATGETSQSLEAVLTENGIQILGAPYFAERTEVGRTPTKHHQSWDFAAVIAEWIEAKGLNTTFNIHSDRDLNKVSKAIAMKISRQGSAKYRGDMPKTDVYSSLILEEIDNLSKIFLASSAEMLMGALDKMERKNGEKVKTKKL